MTDVTQRIECQWCHSQSRADARSCEMCGAPLDIKDLVTDSGWREAPRLRDMTEIHFGSSVCQVEGEVVPVADINLAQGDAVFFEHHVLLWKDESVGMSVMATPGGMKRVLGGMPFVISVASGPGRVAFSRDATGELVVLPLHPSMELDAREHAFLAGVAHHHLFVRAAEGPHQHPPRRRRDVHGPLRDHRRARPAAAARLRQRLRAHARRRGEHPGRARRLPVQGLAVYHERRAAEDARPGCSAAGACTWPA